ncbi:hypothetical protein D9M71_245410 [compost metagenome]
MQKRRNRTGGGDLANQVDLADIDTQFQRRGGHQHLQLAALEPLLGIEPILLGQAAVMGGDRVATQALAQMSRQAFGQAPGVDENQCGAVLAGQRCQALVDQFPHVCGHDRTQGHRWYLDTEITGPRMADIDNAAGAADSHQQARDLFDGLLRGGQADTPQGRRTECLQALQAQGQVAAALARSHGVDFIDNHRVGTAEHTPTGIRAEQHVQRFGGGHQDMRGTLAHGRAFFLQGIAGAHRRADGQGRQAQPGQLGGDSGQRRLQVDLDIVGQRLEWRDVDHQGLVGQLAAVVQALPNQFVQHRKKGRECLA